MPTGISLLPCFDSTPSGLIDNHHHDANHFMLLSQEKHTVFTIIIPVGIEMPSTDMITRAPNPFGAQRIYLRRPIITAINRAQGTGKRSAIKESASYIS